MAIFHLQVNTVSRSAGRSATAAAAYRAGEKIVDERTGEIHDYTRKGGVEASALFAPAGAPEWAADRAQLWNAAEGAENRKNSTVAREFVLALPAELSADERQGLAFEFGRALVERHGVAVDVCIHAPGKEGDERNHHAHILMTTRRMTPQGLTEKTRELDNQRSGEVDHWRQEWAAMANRALERAGRSERIDHRTLAEQGIERQPTTHDGPAVTEIQRSGRTSTVAERREADAAAFVEQVKAEAQALAVDLAKAQAAFDQAQQEVDELKAKQGWMALRQMEDDRLEKLPAEHLAIDVAEMRRRLPNACEVAKGDPAYMEAKAKAEQIADQYSEAAQASNRAETDAANWRERHGIRTWLHDSGLIRSTDLDAFEAQRRESTDLALQLWPQKLQAENQRDMAYRHAVAKADIDLQPDRARLERFQRLLAEKQEAEKAERKRLEQQQQAERRGRYERDQLMRDFKALAVKRELRMAGYTDRSQDWKENTPELLRKVVEKYNSEPREIREIRLQKLLDDPKAAKDLRGLMDERKRSIEQSNELSR